MSSSTPTNSKPLNILFVCLGNICRSPMAEACFLETIGHLPSSKNPQTSLPAEFGTIDSCGTAAYHTGSLPDHRTLSTLKKHNVKGYKHSARKLREQDFEEFDWIFGMDNENLKDIKQVKRRVESKLQKEGRGVEGLAKVGIWGDMGGEKGEEVIDPYYGGEDGFERAYWQMVRFGEGFLQRLASDRERERGESL